MKNPEEIFEDSVPNKVDNVKKRCCDQREVLPGEPQCVICGRYGEYICNETDDDICSLECKHTLLRRLQKSHLSIARPPLKTLPATDECFYVRDLKGKSRDQNLTELLRTKLDILVKGDYVPEPITSFSSCDIPHKLLQNIESAGYEIPTPVQMQAIPAALMGKNLLVSSGTGSGKTGSFLIPIISRCAKFRPDKFSANKNPLTLVLAPTRELCVQVEEHAKLLGKGLPFKTALVIGGDAMASQVYRIKKGVEMIVGTPGRLIDLLTNHEIELEDIFIFVIDEVDLMLQKGFRDHVIEIFTALTQPQLLMCSATISPEVEKVSISMSKELITVSIGKPNKPNSAVKQVAIWVETKRKKQKLFDILTSEKHFEPPVVVFVNSKLGADLLAKAISVMTGLKSESIHGEKPMKERREIMKSFLVGEVPVIVATGVLGRGVDLLLVRQVIVFDMPNSIREYVHQIGRASRLGQAGKSIVFVNEENKYVFRELAEMLKSSGAIIPRELANSPYTNKNVGKRKHGCHKSILL